MRILGFVLLLLSVIGVFNVMLSDDSVIVPVPLLKQYLAELRRHVARVPDSVAVVRVSEHDFGACVLAGIKNTVHEYVCIVPQDFDIKELGDLSFCARCLQKYNAAAFVWTGQQVPARDPYPVIELLEDNIGMARHGVEYAPYIIAGLYPKDRLIRTLARKKCTNLQQLNTVFLWQDATAVYLHTVRRQEPQNVVAARVKVGLLVVATGRYIEFVEPLVNSAQKFFLPTCDVTCFIFTDHAALKNLKNTFFLPHRKLGWPYDTLMRFAAYYKYKNILEKMDYLFACDADMLFVNHVGEEILGDLVGTLHPGYVYDYSPYDTNKASTACVVNGRYYFCGGFYGGKSSVLFELWRDVLEKIKIDAGKNYIARWHDESHLNRYFSQHYPTKILTPSYCFPNNRSIIERCHIACFTPRLVALTKSNHAEYQTI